MKQSQKSVLTILGIFAAIIILIAGYGRVVFSKVDVTELSSEERIMIQPNLTNFNSINASGAWSIELTQGETWAVETSSLEKVKGRISISVEDGTLLLKQRSTGFWFNFDNSDLIATVTMPALTSLDLSGAVEAQISGFDGEQLTIDSAGAVDLEANNSQYNELSIDSAGAVDINFKDMVVTNATVDLSGAADITLNMNGGELSGSLSGAGDIDYYGTVSSESIKVAGAGDITHKK